MTRKEKQFLLELGFNLRQIRHEKGWSLEYAEEKGIPAWQYLQRIETGNHNTTILTLRKLAIVYKLPLRDLIIDV
ncbi:MAG: helix-turn-helix transcriptional regulator [Halobacteriovoraceae bacterium]|nr:helix-turn-helix transcriptional regulator [Halobacteriovoraceae bacterium]